MRKYHLKNISSTEKKMYGKTSNSTNLHHAMTNHSPSSSRRILSPTNILIVKIKFIPNAYLDQKVEIIRFFCCCCLHFILTDFFFLVLCGQNPFVDIIHTEYKGDLLYYFFYIMLVRYVYVLCFTECVMALKVFCLVCTFIWLP